MTETTVSGPATVPSWWTDRLRDRRPELGPPLLRQRSSVYRRRSAHLSQALPTAPGGIAPVVAAVAGVLFRYTGSAEPVEVVVGAADADGRVAPVAVAVSPGATAGELAAGAAAALAEAAGHPGCDVPALLDGLGLGEVRNRNPLFPVLVGRAMPTEDLRHDVTVTVAGSVLEIEYNANVLDGATVARFGGHVAAFLGRSTAEPGTPVHAVEYLSGPERAQLVQWSRGAQQPPPERCLHELVEAAAAAHPDHEALVLEDATTTYAQLEAAANRLAHHLRSVGVTVGTPVGLCVSASPRMLVSTLAILKSGAAAVPIVPTFPASRNQLTVEDSGMPVVVTEEGLRHLFAGPGAPRTVCLDRDAELVAAAPTTAPDAGTTPDDLAYLLFTSGSTGRPKGVPMRHRTLVNLVRWQRERGLDPAGRRTLQRTSIGFDVSFQEIFSTWGYGGCLVVATDEVRDDVSQLPEVIERYGITRLFLPPVALDQMAVTTNLTGRTLPTLREVIVAGEQLRISMPIRRLFHQLDCRLDNQYGPTETHVVTAHVLEGASTRWPAAPPIGRPVANVRVYLLDPWDQPVPVGVPGEIVVGGLAPATGYLDAGQTAQRFGPDPVDPASGPVYRTGDRARFLADGVIEFLGRTDDQVKIRGYRIELGDVEAHLLRLPGVTAAAATVHETETLGKQLAAYVVTDRPGEPDAATIRAAMLEDLPGHMVPAGHSLLHLDALPLTVTGKIDRRALPVPPRSATGPTAGTEGDTEQTVASVWARALELEQVGRDDSFIDLGGHSLIGIQVVAQLNELYSVAVPLRTLLRGTTVAALAAEIDRLRGVIAAAPERAAPTDEVVQHEVVLPGGARIVTPHPAETLYLHLDVFGHRTYERGGVTVPERGVVVDAGAHVGLFALYAAQRSAGPEVLQILSFEPCPPLHAALERNTAHLPGVRRFPFGLGERADAAELTYYPQLTGMTSFHPDPGQERALLGGILENLEKLGENATSSRLADSEEYLAERLQTTTYTVQRRRLSAVLAELEVCEVDLLKIDVQKAELEVLAGVDDADWPRIRQVVVELHDLDGGLERVTGLLEGRGYRVQALQDPLHEGTAVHFVYAVRP